VWGTGEILVPLLATAFYSKILNLGASEDPGAKNISTNQRRDDMNSFINQMKGELNISANQKTGG
jgi:hypothetical protein